MADGLVQKDAGPAGAKDDVHAARRGLDRAQVHLGDPQCLGHHRFPGFGLHQLRQAVPAALAHAAGFAAAAVL